MWMEEGNKTKGGFVSGRRTEGSEVHGAVWYRGPNLS